MGPESMTQGSKGRQQSRNEAFFSDNPPEPLEAFKLPLEVYDGDEIVAVATNGDAARAAVGLARPRISSN